jgi:hypothetical protein
MRHSRLLRSGESYWQKHLPVRVRGAHACWRRVAPLHKASDGHRSVVVVWRLHRGRVLPTLHRSPLQVAVLQRYLLDIAVFTLHLSLQGACWVGWPSARGF